MWVTIGSGEGTGVSVHVQGERFLVGSGEECQLRLNADDKVATLHAYFEVEADGRVLLHDLGSDSGTLVNGRKIDQPAVIEGGEHIRIGDTELVPTVEAPEEEARERAAALLHEDAGAPVRVKTEEGDVVEVVPEHDGDEQPHLRVRTEDEVVEVVPVGEHRRLRDRIRLATALSALAGVVAVAAIVVLASRGDEPSTPEIVSDARARTVLVDAKIPGGESGGSGFVLDAKNGLIVTNFHVVNGSSDVLVGLDGDSRDAKLFSAAPCDDLAVLKVTDTKGMKAFPLADQDDVDEGDRVVAVGYPANAALDTTLTSTQGVVSVARSSFRAPSADAPSYPNVIQTDAALNPGNSGGPLIGADKKLVGVNAATLLRSGGTPIQGQGYAIGVDRVKQVLTTLRTGKSQGFGGFGILFPGGRKRPGGGAIGVPMDADASGEAFLLRAVNGTRISGTFASYCDAVRSIRSGQTAVLTVQPKPGAAPEQLKIKFRSEGPQLRRSRVRDDDHVPGEVRALARARPEEGRLVDPAAGVGQAPPAGVARVGARAVGVAEDDVRRVDREAVEDGVHRAQRGVAQRLAAEIGPERAEAGRVERSHRRGHRHGAGQPRERAPVVGSVDRLPRLRRAVRPHETAPRGRRLCKRVDERVDGSDRRLVVVGPRVPRWYPLGDALDGPDGDALERRHRVVHVEVVAVRGVHVVAHPHSRIGGAQLRVGEHAGEPRGRGADRLGLELASLRAQPLDQRRHGLVVVVAGQHRHPPARHRAIELGEHRACGGQHVGHRRLAQLEHVAEQDELVDVAQRAGQGRQDGLAAEQVAARAGAEVEVADDGGGHRGYLEAPRPCPRSSVVTTASPPTARSARRARCSTRRGSPSGRARRARGRSRSSAPAGPPRPRRARRAW